MERTIGPNVQRLRRAALMAGGAALVCAGLAAAGWWLNHAGTVVLHAAPLTQLTALAVIFAIASLLLVVVQRPGLQRLATLLIVVPLVTGAFGLVLLPWFERDSRLSASLGVLVVAAAAGALLWWTARALESVERERRVTAEALNEEAHKLTLLTRQLPAAIWTTDANLRIVSASTATLRELGFADGAIQGQPLRLLASGTGAPVEAAHRQALGGEAASYELVIDGRTLAVRLEPLRNREERIIGVIGLALDVTEQRWADQTRRRDLARLEALHAIDQAIISARGPAEIAAATVGALSRLLPYQHAVVLLWDPQAAAATVLAAAGEPVAIDPGEALQLLGNVTELSKETTVAEADGALTVPLVARGALIGALRLTPLDGAFTAEQRGLVAEIVRPLAIALQEARLVGQVIAGRERLHVLSRQLVAVQEEERRAIARELHDEIGQSLTGLKFVLELAARSVAGHPGNGIAEAQAIVDDLVRHVRELSLNLRPAMLDDLGLVPTLHWHLERYSAQTGIAVSFAHAAAARYAAEQETAIYRITQEALTNIARYAGVSRATVRLWDDGGSLGVQIADEGCGFDAEAALAAHGSSGLAGMRERATLLGGRLTIDSVVGQGTQVTAELPVSGTIERRARERE